LPQPSACAARLVLMKAINQVLKNMKSRTLRVIIILVATLFLNIEAAQAGLIQKLKLYFRQEFPHNEFLLLFGGLVFAAFIVYVLFAPVLINKQKWSWLNYYSYQPGRQDYKSKRITVKKISEILQNTEFTNQVHS
jgi:hypothetical protein